MNEDLATFTPGFRTWTRRNNAGVVTFGPVEQSTSSATSESRNVIKGGLRPKPKGWLFPTPYYFEQQNWTFPHGKAKVVQASYTDEYVGVVSALFTSGNAGNLMPGGDTSKGKKFPNVDMLSQAESKALNKLLTHGNDRDGTFQVGQAWAERKETARLLEDAANKCFRALRDLRDGRPVKAFRELFPNGSPKDWRRLKGTPYWAWYQAQLRRLRGKVSPKELASGYLALQNGWKPLLNDVHNAAEALAFRDELADWVITGKGYYKVTNTVHTPITPTGQPQLRSMHDWHRVLAVFVRLDATVLDQHLHRLAQLGLNNPAALVWEVTRLSYVFDYFVAVGDWLQSLGAIDGMKFYSGSYTRYGSYHTEFRSDSSGNYGWYGHGKWVKWDRTPYTGFPIPLPPLSLKPKSLNLSQLANMAALATLYLSGSRPVDATG